METVLSVTLEYMVKTLNLSPPAIVVIALLLCVIFRERITEAIRSSMRIFSPKVRFAPNIPLDSFADDIKIVVIFRSHLVIADAEEFVSALDEMVEQCRVSSRVLVLNFMYLEEINECTRIAIAAAVRAAVDLNNIRMLVIFPSPGIDQIDSLYSETYEYATRNGHGSVRIKRDERTSGDRD